MLDRQAADRTRPPKRKVPLSLTELRERWRVSAIRAFGARTIYRLAERAWVAAATVRAGAAGAAPPVRLPPEAVSALVGARSS